MVIIADDLTGACDTGAGFARAGWRTLVVLDMQRGSVDIAGVDALVFSTESRYLPVDEAMHTIERAVHAIAADVAASADDDQLQHRLPLKRMWVYKKIDSTLRGHPGAELAALMRALGIARALVAPAFPAQGRTTINSRTYVNGEVLEQTPFAVEAGNGDLRMVFGGWGYPVHAIGLDEVRTGGDGLVRDLRELRGIVVADAQTEEDLAALAMAARDSKTMLLCGSAGLAHALLRIGAQSGSRDGNAAHVDAGASPSPRPHRPVLVIAGSRNPVTARQIEVAYDHGVAVIPVPPELGLVVGAGLVPAQLAPFYAELVHATAACLDAGRDVIVTTTGLSKSLLGKEVIASRLGAVTAAVLTHSIPGALVLTGGDIATAVCTALEAHSLELLDELQPGIALGRLADGVYAGIYVITKAGGFGRPESLWEIVRTIGDF